MDYVTRQFINLTKKFRKEWRVLLELLRKDIQEHTRAIRDSKETTKHNQNAEPKIKLSAELHTPKEVETDRNRRDDRQYGIQRLLAIGTWGAFIAAAIYAGLTYHQIRVTKRQFAESQRVSKEQFDTAQKASLSQFHQSERPYVWVKSGELGTPEFVLDKTPATGADLTTGQVVWTFHVTNYGKSPALNVMAETYMRVGPKKPFRKSFKTDDVVTIGTPLAPGEDDAFGVISNPEIDPDKLREYLKLDNAIGIRARITYTDAEGTPYETGICLSRALVGLMHYCEGNYIH
jgi:hypothetical protein